MDSGPDSSAIQKEPALPASGPALWAALAQRAGQSLSERQAAGLARYLDLLLAANQTMNLTRITDRSAAEIQHVGDALTLLPFLPGGPFELADVGSGGGVPGIPLAIVRPDARVLLIESTKKKAVILRRVAAELNLANVHVSDQRAEDLAHSGGDARERFDVAVARAVATLAWLAEWCLPLVKPGGRMLAMKGPKVSDELPAAAAAIRLCGGGKPISHPVVLPGTANHLIIEIPKTRACDRRYPRSATAARGRPLG